MRRRTFLEIMCIAGVPAAAGCTELAEVDGDVVVEETVRGGGDIFFEAESGDTIHFWADVADSDEGVGVLMDPEGHRLMQVDIRTETAASAQTDRSGEHTLHIASGPTVRMDVEIALE